MKVVSLEVWCPDLASEEGVAWWRHELSRDWPWVVEDPGIVVEAWRLRRGRGPSLDPRFRARGPVVPLSVPTPAAIVLAWVTHVLLAIFGAASRGRVVALAPTPYSALGFACARVLGARLPLVTRVQGHTASKQRFVHKRPRVAGIVERIEGFAVRRADLVLPMGAFTRSLAEGAQVPPERIVELPFPTAWRDGHVPAGPRDAGLVACAARLVPEKGLDMLLRAFAKVAREIPTARLEIAGDGPERARLEGLASSLGLGDRVAFRGWLQPEEMRRFWARAAIAVLPSRWEEGLGMVLVEAGLAGCALVGSDLGGIRDIVRPGRSGLLVPSEDQEALAAALSRLLSDPDRSALLGAAAREDVLEYLARRERALEEVRGRVLALVAQPRSGRRG